jgi:hypothetical protein
MEHEIAGRLISFLAIFILVALWEIRMPRFLVLPMINPHCNQLNISIR